MGNKPRRLRRWIVLGILGLLVVAVSMSLSRGLRYPPLQWDPEPVATTLYDAAGWRVHAEGGYARGTAKLPTVRASAPNVALRFEAVRDTELELRVENVHPEATLAGGTEGVDEVRRGLQRTLRFAMALGSVRELRYTFPQRATYRFAAIGDGGGTGELRWCFERAAALEADFLLHLGDIAYRDIDFEAAVDAFRESPIPVYAAVGNHDFHGGFRYRFRFFQEHFGPLNSRFSLGGVDFLNLDTAADLVPKSRGSRGRLLGRIADERKERGAERPLVVFTHRPFADPRKRKAGDPHALNRTGEANWLRKELLDLGATALLAGHIHASRRFVDEGLLTYISGDGLGRREERARILLGEYALGAPDGVSFRWAKLQMPPEVMSPVDENDPYFAKMAAQAEDEGVDEEAGAAVEASAAPAESAGETDS